MVQWFCLISWLLFDVWTSLFWIMNRYDPTVDLKVNVGHCELYFTVQWFCYILKTSWMNSIVWDYGSAWHSILPLNKWRSLWPIFHSPVICLISPTMWCLSVIFTYNDIAWLYILKTISWINMILGILFLWDAKIDIIINKGHLGPYFMVQWFCLISWMLFDVWTSLFWIMNRYDPTVDLKVNVGHCELYFTVHWFYYRTCL